MNSTSNITKEGVEDEKKFLFGYIPEKLGEGADIVQVYLKKDDPLVLDILQRFFEGVNLANYTEVRIRSKDKGGKLEFYLTIKGKGDEKRPEVERPISSEIFHLLFQSENVWDGQPIKKRRHERMIVNYPKPAEIDIYRPAYEGLVTGELEYESTRYTSDQILEIMMREFGLVGRIIDVTKEEIFKNAKLAKWGGMEGLIKVATSEQVACINTVRSNR